MNNLESKRRQFNLVEHARELGFRDVQTIDDDLGRTASGYVERPGFQRLVAEVCAGQVGAILCIEASRLARNGRDWHHLIELCGLVGAVVIDPDGIYDPGVINDRLLLGLKGTMSEFELNLLRQRCMEAIRLKAGRGELRFCLPAGYYWSHNGKIEMDPDVRVQQAINLVFSKMTELASVRQVLLWLRTEQVSLPIVAQDEFGRNIVWKSPVYFNVHSILTNPLYAGAYAFGKTERRTHVTDGRARKTDGHRKPIRDWTVLIKDHHPGYITWEQFERNQQKLAENAHMGPGAEPKAGRGGRALLSSLMRCARCGRMLHVWYHSERQTIRYHCFGTNIEYGGNLCISFGGSRVERAVFNAVTLEILNAIAVTRSMPLFKGRSKFSNNAKKHDHARGFPAVQDRGQVSFDVVAASNLIERFAAAPDREFVDDREITLRAPKLCEPTAHKRLVVLIFRHDGLPFCFQ